VFSGRFEHAIDDKGRVSIPARFREVLERNNHERLFITNWYGAEGEPCLELYPPNLWQELLDKAANQPRFSANMQTFEVFFIGGAHEVPVDRQGRILIPSLLREFAGLYRDVLFSAVRDHFQLWDKARLEKVLKTSQERIRDPQFFEKLNF